MYILSLNSSNGIKIKTAISSCLLIFVLFTIIGRSSLYSILAGRQPKDETKEIEWVYAENKAERVIGFVEFENLTKDRKEIYENYKTSLPGLIAEKLNKVKSLEISSNDFVPEQKKISQQYTIKELTFQDAKETPELLNQVIEFGTVINVDLLTNITSTNQDTKKTNALNTQSVVITTNIVTNQTSLGEVLVTNTTTNQIKVDVASLGFFSALTNTRIAYVQTNVKLQKYTFYLFKKDPDLYFDPELLRPYEKYFNTKLTSSTISNQAGAIIYPIDRNKTKSFKIDSKLYRLNDAPIGNILEKKGVDYFVYGSYKVNRNQMELNVYIINSFEKKITHVYRDVFLSSKIREKTDILDIRILSFLQQRKIVKNLNITSDPPGALIKLDNRFIGKLPITLKEWIKGTYTFEVWQPNRKVSRIISDTKITTNTSVYNKSDTQTTFSFEDNPKGLLDINIDNQVSGDYYLNTKLIKKNTSNYSGELFTGEYYVSVAKSNYVTRNFKINVEPNTKTTLSFGLTKKKPKTRFEEIFLDYSLNTKIFGALSFAFGAASFGLFIHTLRLEDQKNSSQKRIEELNAAGLDSSDESLFNQQLSQDYQRYLGISLGVFSGSVVSLITMLVFHTLDVWSNHAPIETSFNHKGDVEIKYIKEF